MKRTRLGIVVLCLLAILGLALACARATPTPATPAPAAPTPAPVAATPAPTPAPTPTPVAATPVAKVRDLALGTGHTAASGLYVWNVAVARAINKQAKGLRVTVYETPGGTPEVLKNLEKYDIHGLGLEDPTRKFFGTLEWEGKASPELRMLYVAGLVLFTNAVAKDSGIKSIYELDGQPFGSSYVGSASEIILTRLLDGLGIKPKYARVGAAEQIELYKDKRIVGFMKGGAPEPTVLEAHVSRPLIILEVKAEDLAKAEKFWEGKGQFFAQGWIPADAYPWMGDKPISTYTLTLGHYTASRLPEDVAYAVVKAVWTEREAIGTAYKPYKESMLNFPEQTFARARFPLHIGAVKFYQELGLKVPERLLPPEYRR